ncbi:unnamed protein product [Cunninghamella blakesleeana]
MDKSQLQNKRNATLFLLPLSSSQQQNINESILNINESILNQNDFHSISDDSILTASLYSTFTDDLYDQQQQQQQQISPSNNHRLTNYSLSDQNNMNDNDDYSASPISSSSSSSLSPSPSPQSLKNRTNRSTTTATHLLDDHPYPLTNISSSSSSTFSSLLDLTSAEKLANDLWDETQTFCKHKDITIWLGTNDPFRKYVLQCYMNHFNFTGQRLDGAFRNFAKKLYLKAEAQQLDRVIEAFAKKFWECNPNDELYYNADIVYVITYSLLLLNTDLYNANHHKKMNQSQFTKNTMETIIPLLTSNSDDNDDGDDDVVSSTNFEISSLLKSQSKKQSDPSCLTTSQTFTCLQDTELLPTKTKNPLDKSQSLMDLNDYQQQNKERISSFLKDQKKWIIQMESLLKTMYTSIKENEIGLCTTIQPSDNASNGSKHLANVKMGDEFKKRPYKTLKRGKSITSLSTSILSNHLKSKKKGGFQN